MSSAERMSRQDNATMMARLHEAIRHLGPHLRNTLFSILARKWSTMKQYLEVRFSAFGPGMKPN